MGSNKTIDLVCRKATNAQDAVLLLDKAQGAKRVGGVSNKIIEKVLNQDEDINNNVKELDRIISALEKLKKSTDKNTTHVKGLLATLTEKNNTTSINIEALERIACIMEGVNKTVDDSVYDDHIKKKYEILKEQYEAYKLALCQKIYSMILTTHGILVRR